MNGIISGQASTMVDHKNWLLGHFRDQDSGLQCQEIEIKVSAHSPGDKPHYPSGQIWSASRVAVSIVIMISGRHRLIFPQQEVELCRPLDFVVWPPGTFHHWLTLEPSQLLCIRGPSVPSEVVFTNEPTVDNS